VWQCGARALARETLETVEQASVHLIASIVTSVTAKLSPED